MNDSNRRRLVRFCMLRQQLCPICNNLIYFDNKDKIYKCRNVKCDFVENSINEEIKINQSISKLTSQEITI